MSAVLRKVKRLVLADDTIKPFLKLPRDSELLEQLTERELIQLESRVGQTIFGELPPHVLKRDFFNLDENTWIWHEEVEQSDGTILESTTRYEVQPKGILMVQPGPKYTYLEGVELHNFVLAVKAYYERVSREVYKRDPQTGEKVRQYT